MKWSELRTSPDAATRALAVIGDRWTLILLAECVRGVVRFEALQRSHGLSRSVVADRLKLLTAEGILRRCRYQGRRYEYRLTEKGLALAPLFSLIEAWAGADGSAAPAGRAGANHGTDR